MEILLYIRGLRLVRRLRVKGHQRVHVKMYFCKKRRRIRRRTVKLNVLCHRSSLYRLEKVRYP